MAGVIRFFRKLFSKNPPEEENIKVHKKVTYKKPKISNFKHCENDDSALALFCDLDDEPMLDFTMAKLSIQPASADENKREEFAGKMKPIGDLKDASEVDSIGWVFKPRDDALMENQQVHWADDINWSFKNLSEKKHK